MTSSSEWTQIAEACESAEGPDREIDARMAAALRFIPDRPEWCEESRLTVPVSYMTDHERVVMVTLKKGERLLSRVSPPYTSSLDAITEAIKWEFPDPYFGIGRASRKDGRDWLAIVPGSGWSPSSLGVTTEVFNEKLCAYARTYVLALCAAFCRAMAVKAEKDAKKEATDGAQ